MRLKGEKEMEETRNVVISKEEYRELICAKRNIEIIRAAVDADGGSYGYNSDTSKVIDIVLRIRRGTETTGGEE